MDRGALVPDEIVAQALAEELGRPEASRGFVLDGYPRRADQGATLDTMLGALPNPARLDCAIYLELDVETARTRLANRLTCSECGRPDRKPLISRGDPCPGAGCAGRMEEREDDLNEETIERRIETFFEETFPLVDYYEGRDLLVRVDARRASDVVVADVEAELERRRG